MLKNHNNKFIQEPNVTPVRRDIGVTENRIYVMTLRLIDHTNENDN